MKRNSTRVCNFCKNELRDKNSPRFTWGSSRSGGQYSSYANVDNGIDLSINIITKKGKSIDFCCEECKTRFYGKKSTSWHTVPDFFPDYSDLSVKDQYHLFEGYGVSSYETKLSGTRYKSVRVNGSFEGMMSYLGWQDWHKRWRPKRSIITGRTLKRGWEKSNKQIREEQ